MSGRSGAWATALLVALCGALGTTLVFELTGQFPIATHVAAAPPLPPVLDRSNEPLEFEAPAREAFDIIAARPLFSPSRRLYVEAAGGAPLPAAPLPDAPASAPPLELVGVLLTDTQRYALIRPLDDSAPGRVREGEAVAGWHVEAIERGRVHLSAGTRLESLELRRDTAVPTEARPTRRQAPEGDAPGGSTASSNGIESVTGGAN